MERVVRPPMVPTADLQSLPYEQVAFSAAGHGPVAGLTQPAAPRPLIIPPIPPFQAAGPSPIQARSDRAALLWQGRAPGWPGARDLAAQASQQVWRKHETSH